VAGSGEGPAWVVFPVRRAESEVAGRPGVGSSAVPGSGAVLAEPGVRSADVPKSGRVLRVVICETCGWQYGSYWPRSDPVTWGDCPRCGGVTVIESGYRAAFGTGVDAERGVDTSAGGRGAWREALGPAQQELGL
jgi:hypothetical protein